MTMKISVCLAQFFKQKNTSNIFLNVLDMSNFFIWQIPLV